MGRPWGESMTGLKGEGADGQFPLMELRSWELGRAEGGVRCMLYVGRAGDGGEGGLLVRCMLYVGAGNRGNW